MRYSIGHVSGPGTMGEGHRDHLGGILEAGYHIICAPV